MAYDRSQTLKGVAESLSENMKVLKSGCYNSPLSGVFSLAEREGRQFDQPSALQGRLVGAQPYTGPVSGAAGVGKCWPVLFNGGDELVDHMGVRAAVAGALGEAQVFVGGQIVHAFRSKPPDRPGQQVGEIGDVGPQRDFRFGTFGGVKDMAFSFDQRHSNDCLDPNTSMLSLYWRAVSKSER